MQITAFKAILARIINIQGCEDYENTFARMESDCTLRFGFKVLIKSISYTKQSNNNNNNNNFILSVNFYLADTKVYTNRGHLKLSTYLLK